MGKISCLHHENGKGHSVTQIRYLERNETVEDTESTTNGVHRKRKKKEGKKKKSRIPPRSLAR
jgi:hypothetical protein